MHWPKRLWTRKFCGKRVCAKPVLEIRAIYWLSPIKQVIIITTIQLPITRHLISIHADPRFILAWRWLCINSWKSGESVFGRVFSLNSNFFKFLSAMEVQGFLILWTFGIIFVRIAYLNSWMKISIVVTSDIFFFLCLVWSVFFRS